MGSIKGDGYVDCTGRHSTYRRSTYTIHSNRQSLIDDYVDMGPSPVGSLFKRTPATESFNNDNNIDSDIQPTIEFEQSSRPFDCLDDDFAIANKSEYHLDYANTFIPSTPKRTRANFTLSQTQQYNSPNHSTPKRIEDIPDSWKPKDSRLSPTESSTQEFHKKSIFPLGTPTKPINIPGHPKNFLVQSTFVKPTKPIDIPHSSSFLVQSTFVKPKIINSPSVSSEPSANLLKLHPKRSFKLYDCMPFRHENSKLVLLPEEEPTRAIADTNELMGERTSLCQPMRPRVRTGEPIMTRVDQRVPIRLRTDSTQQDSTTPGMSTPQRGNSEQVGIALYSKNPLMRAHSVPENQCVLLSTKSDLMTRTFYLRRFSLKRNRFKCMIFVIFV